MEREKENITIARKQFRFRLQTVLDYRRELLDQVQQRVAEEEKRRLDLYQQLQEYDQLIETSYQDQRQLLERPEFDPAIARNFAQFLMKLKQERFGQSQRVAAQDKKLAVVREELKQALIATKSLEVLKDKQYKKYLKELEKEDEAFLSELALNKFYRRELERRESEALKTGS